MFEACDSPKIMLILPALEDIKRKLRMIDNEVRQRPEFAEVSSEDQSLASSILFVLDRIILYHSWAATCLLHPRLRTLSFVQDVYVISNLNIKWKRLLQNMFNKAAEA